MGVEVRKVENEVYETGVAQANRVDTTYELGAEINGAWVAFATVPASKVDAAVQASQAQAQAEATPSPQEAPATESSSSSEEPPADQGGSSEASPETPQA